MSTPISPTDLLTRCFMAGVAAAAPERALATALPPTGPSTAPVYLLAAGKASRGMSLAMVEWLASHGRDPVGGLIIGTEDVIAPHRALHTMVGDHPIPGEGSARAADAIGALIVAMPPDAEVHVAISGGASALIAGALPPLTMPDVTTTFSALLSSGLDIREMNALRKRVTRWSAGRLAIALGGRRVFAWLVSDVPGDAPSDIGSGPCSGDPWTGANVEALIERMGGAHHLSGAVRAAMGEATPKPDDGRIAGVHVSVIANNRTALCASAAEVARLGMGAVVVDEPLSGEARTQGAGFVDDLRATHGTRSIILRGGETTVTIRGPSGRGGRCQELALAAAKAMQGERPGMALLAAGTDGRDGPTDAAGAIVDGTTWDRIVAAGIDPEEALERHDAYTALDAVGALLRTGTTGTNVADLVIAISAPALEP